MIAVYQRRGDICTGSVAGHKPRRIRRGAIKLWQVDDEQRVGRRIRGDVRKKVSGIDRWLSGVDRDFNNAQRREEREVVTRLRDHAPIKMRFDNEVLALAVTCLARRRAYRVS